MRFILIRRINWAPPWTWLSKFRSQNCWPRNTGVRKIFPRGGNVDILLTRFRLLLMQCKRTFTKLLVLSTSQRKCPICHGDHHKNALRWQKWPVYYDNLHNRLYTDFENRVILFKETLPWSLKKGACHGPTLCHVASEPLKVCLTLFYVAIELLKICGHRIVTKIKINRRTMPLQVSRPAFAGKGTDMSELKP